MSITVKGPVVLALPDGEAISAEAIPNLLKSVDIFLSETRSRAGDDIVVVRQRLIDAMTQMRDTSGTTPMTILNDSHIRVDVTIPFHSLKDTRADDIVAEIETLVRSCRGRRRGFMPKNEAAFYTSCFIPCTGPAPRELFEKFTEVFSSTHLTDIGLTMEVVYEIGMSMAVSNLAEV